MYAFMRAAIEEALKGRAEGGVPIGAVLVENGRIIGRGRNRRVQQKDQLMHAEVDCLRAARLTGGYHDTELYSTLMPCYLCVGAVVQFGIKKVVVGEAESAPGAREFMQSHGIEVDESGLATMQATYAGLYSREPDSVGSFLSRVESGSDCASWKMFGRRVQAEMKRRKPYDPGVTRGG